LARIGAHEERRKKQENAERGDESPGRQKRNEYDNQNRGEEVSERQRVEREEEQAFCPAENVA